MESGIDRQTAEALLAWQVEMGATEAIGDKPVDRYAIASPSGASSSSASGRGVPPPGTPAAPGPGQPPHALPSGAVPDQASDAPDPVALAAQAAQSATTLEELQAALEAFEGCELKRGARSTVFCDGIAGARVMVIGEAPGRDEDRDGKPFVGRAGQLLDLMLAPVGLSRQENVYITNVLPWRPPQNRDPRPDEIAMMKPFLAAHVRLAKPEVLVIMGNISCQALLGKRGITRLRGTWDQALDLPALPMFHPAYLLRNPPAKRAAWADMLELRVRLDAL
ncbi:MAG: uracil-DNA glycosylase [Pseudomonadota bacterium]